MGRIVVSQFVSADGVIEDPVGIESLGRGSWTSLADSGAEGGAFKVDEMLTSEAMLMGRTTYEGYAAAWSSRDGEYADKINRMPKYVVSRTLTEPGWNNSTVLRGDIPAEVDRVRRDTSGDILVDGSPQLTDLLIAHGLIDEWRLMIYPVVVGAGKRCFGDPGGALALRLVESRAVGDGIAILVYQPVSS